MNKRPSLAAGLALLFLITANTPRAQDQGGPQANTPSYRLSVGANLVLVPVVVTDRHGRHMSGLSSDNFEVLENGKPQHIAAFEEVTAESTVVQTPALAPNTFTNRVIATHPKNLEIILLDLLNTPLSGRAEARRGLIEFLSRSSHADSLLALLVLRSDGVTMIHNFTSDPRVLQDAIRKVEAPAGSRDSPALDTKGGDADAEARMIRSILLGQGAIGVPAIRGLQAQTDLSHQNMEAYLTQQCLIQIARYFAAVPGRKSLVWASGGFMLRPTMDVALQSTTPDLWRTALQALQDANIAVYPVDVGGLNLGAEADVAHHGIQPEFAPFAVWNRPGGRDDPNRGKHESMDNLADGTGGRAFYNQNDSAELFERVRQDSAQYYMLAYYTKEAGTRGWRKLHVRVSREGVQVRARSGFFFNGTARNFESTHETDEIMALTSALESTSLTINGQWKQIEPAGDQRKVHFVLSIPPEGILIDADAGNSVNVDFLVFAWDQDGKQAARLAQKMEKKLSGFELSEAKTHGTDYENVLTLAPGEYNVHIVVRDNLSGRLGSVVTKLKLE